MSGVESVTLSRSGRRGSAYLLEYAAKLARACLAVERSAFLQRVTGAPASRQPLRIGDAAPPPGLLADSDFLPANEPGFGDHWNTYPWCMFWWRGRLYVGTNRAFPCVEYYRLHTVAPWLQRYPPRLDPETCCTASPFDLPLRAEIWRYTPHSGVWDRVFQSPGDVAVPGHPGKALARDIGFRGMGVFQEGDGEEALYVAGVSARTICPNAPPPRILRSSDGEHFRPVPQDPGTVLGDLDSIGLRSITVHDERLFVNAGSLYGDGIVFEAANPAGGNNSFRRISDARVFEMASFNGWLYLGLRDLRQGYAVVKTKPGGFPPYSFKTVVGQGGFLGRWCSKSVLSMHVHDGALYVGTDTPAELIRVHPDDSWDLLVGKARKTPHGWKKPLSGLDEGFGYPLNREIERLEHHAGWLYVGVVDFSAYFRWLPFARSFVGERTGFGLYATRDGVTFWQVTGNGFGDPRSNAVRTLASTPEGLFLGAINLTQGARVFLGRRRAASAPA